MGASQEAEQTLQCLARWLVPATGEPREGTGQESSSHCRHDSRWKSLKDIVCQEAAAAAAGAPLRAQREEGEGATLGRGRSWLLEQQLVTESDQHQPALGSLLRAGVVSGDKGASLHLLSLPQPC